MGCLFSGLGGDLCLAFPCGGRDRSIDARGSKCPGFAGFGHPVC